MGADEDEPIEGEGQIDGKQTSKDQGEATTHSERQKHGYPPPASSFLDKKNSVNTVYLKTQCTKVESIVQKKSEKLKRRREADYGKDEEDDGAKEARGKCV